MIRQLLAGGSLALALSSAAPARAVSSAEFYQTASATYGRFEARIRFAAGDGVVSSFFMWKPGSEVAGTFWNELDFEKLGADCHMQTNPLYGAPVVDHGQIAQGVGDLCGAYHTYAFEWTPTYIAWLIDGAEVRHEEGDTAAAFATNAASGMQIHFNIWPGDASFGGNFDPAILPVHQFISWVRYSAFENGTFALKWEETFAAGALPSGWATGNWASPKNHSTHAPANVVFTSGSAVLSLTADDATGFTGQLPPDDSADPGPGDASGGSSGGSSAGSSNPDTGAPAATPDPGQDPVGNGMGGSATTNSGPATGTGTGTATGSRAGTGAGGAAPTESGGGGMPALTAGPASSGSHGGCDLGATGSGATVHSGELVLAGIALARRRRQAVGRSARP